MAVSAGTRLGPYEILEPLGAGGMGEVYRARDPRLEREVALKVLRPEVASDPDRLRRFERETKTAALPWGHDRHGGIVPLAKAARRRPVRSSSEVQLHRELDDAPAPLE